MKTEEPRRDAPDLTGSAETEEEISSGYAHYVLGVLLTCSLGAVLFALAGRTIEKDMEAGRQTALAV